MREIYNDTILEKVTDYKNPKCKNCVDCCTIFTPITERELKKLVKVGKKLKKFIESNWETDYDREIFDATCPFADKKAKRCVVYKDKPEVCSAFHCSMELNRIPRLTQQPKYFIYNVFGTDIDTINIFEGMRREMEKRGLL